MSVRVRTSRSIDSHHRSPRRIALGIAITATLAAGLGLFGSSAATAADAPVDLGTAGSFAVLGGSTVTNTGPSVISGNLGVSPGNAVTGFPPGIVINGVIHATDAVATQAQSDLTVAYNTAASSTLTDDVTGQDLGGLTLVPGVYEATSSMQLTGALTLDAQGDPDARFVFKAGSTLTTASNSAVALINGASPCNVYWQVGSSATLGTNTTFVGSIMALTSATLVTGSSVEGRVLARNGAVTLDTNDITAPDCDTNDDDDDDTTDDDNADGGDTTDGGDSGTGGSGDSGTGGSDSSGTTDATGGSPIVPLGHPLTGLGGSASTGTDVWLLLVGGVAAGGAVIATVRAARIIRRP